jgi:hypothetical protein
VITALIGPISNLASTWLEGKVEKGKAKVKADVAKAEAEAIVMQKKATGEIDWDLEMAKGSHNSWKDEWLVVNARMVSVQSWGHCCCFLWGSQCY